MRKLFTALTAASMVLLGAAAGHAGTLIGGALQIRLSALPPLGAPANVGGATYDGTNVVELTAPQAFGPVSIDVPDSLFTGVPSISDLKISNLAKPGGGSSATLSPGAGPAYTGNVAAAGGGLGGIAPLSGNTTICVFSCAFIQVKIPLTNVGAGGVVTFTALGQPGTVTAGTGWTTGAAVINNINTEVLSFAGNTCVGVTCGSTTLALGTGIGVYQTSVTLSGTNHLTAGGNGQVTFVTPVRTNSLAGALPLFATQTLVFGSVPEPGTLLLLGAGVAGLAVVGRRKMQR